MSNLRRMFTTIEVTDTSYDGYTRPFVVLAKDGNIIPFTIESETTNNVSTICPFMVHGSRSEMNNILISSRG